MDIGDKLKRLRIKTNLTQEELANRCELTKGFISQLERNLTSPSIATLVNILESLGTNLKDFFNDNSNEKVVFHSEDVSVQENADMGYVINWIIPNAQKNKMEPILLRVSPNGRSETFSPHEGEVFGYVIQGGIIIHIGSQRYKAKKDEGFYYTANAPYFIENANRSEAVVLWITTPPNF